MKGVPERRRIFENLAVAGVLIVISSGLLVLATQGWFYIAYFLLGVACILAFLIAGLVRYIRETRRLRRARKNEHFRSIR
jgi:bacteriorhodopsin